MMKASLYILGICVAAATAQVPKFEDLDTRKKIVVIDTPMADTQVDKSFMCKNGTVPANIGYKSHFSAIEQNVHGYQFRHGENIINIIASKMDERKYCIYHIAWYVPGQEQVTGGEDKRFYLAALNKVKTLKNVVAINMSLAGPNKQDSYLGFEFDMLEQFTASGIKVIVAAGNEHTELKADNCWTYPACLQKKVSHPENFYVVSGKLTHEGRQYQNYSSFLKVELEEWQNQGEPMFSGTSQATANFTSKMFSRGNL